MRSHGLRLVVCRVVVGGAAGGGQKQSMKCNIVIELGVDKVGMFIWFLQQIGNRNAVEIRCVSCGYWRVHANSLCGHRFDCIVRGHIFVRFVLVCVRAIMFDPPRFGQRSIY